MNAAGFRRGRQKPVQRLFRCQARGLVLHVQKVPGILKGAEMAVANVVGEVPGVGSRGVFVPCAIHEQHRHIDALGRFHLRVIARVQHMIDVVVHLRVLMRIQGADVLVVVALEQRGQVFAQGAVEQLPDAMAVVSAEVLPAALGGSRAEGR